MTAARSVGDLAFNAQDHDAVAGAHFPQCCVELRSASAPFVALEFARHKQWSVMNDESIEPMDEHLTVTDPAASPINELLRPFRHGKSEAVRSRRYSYDANGYAGSLHTVTPSILARAIRASV